MSTPCTQELRIKKIEDKVNNNDTGLKDLATTVSGLTKKLDILIKVLVVIAGKVALGLLFLLWYFFKMFVVERGL